MSDAVKRGGAWLAGLGAAVAGVLLFAYAVRRAGIAEIAGGIRRVGVWFLLILLISGVRETVRTLAWMLCIEAPHRVRFRDAFAARQTGEAIGNLTPFSLLASEPTKAIYLRDRAPVVAALSGTAIENIFYSFTVIAMLAMGTAALLATVTLGDAVLAVTLLALVVVAGVAAGGVWLLRSRPRIGSRLVHYLASVGLGGPRRLEQMRGLEDRIYGFFQHNRRRLLPLALLESIFHAAGVAEAYVTLSLLSAARAPTWLDAFIVEAVNRFIIVVFKVIPLRLGVEEAGTGLITDALGYGATMGVTIGIVRKARVLAWSAVGVLLLVKRGLTPRRVRAEAQELGLPESR